MRLRAPPAWVLRLLSAPSYDDLVFFPDAEKPGILGSAAVGRGCCDHKEEAFLVEFFEVFYRADTSP
jgi:hypothetical protein